MEADQTPPLGSSAAGRLLAPVVGYVRRRDAVRQASMWNTVLQREADEGQGSRDVVEVGERGPDRLWYLTWRTRPADGDHPSPRPPT